MLWSDSDFYLLWEERSHQGKLLEEESKQGTKIHKCSSYNCNKYAKKNAPADPDSASVSIDKEICDMCYWKNQSFEICEAALYTKPCTSILTMRIDKDISDGKCDNNTKSVIYDFNNIHGESALSFYCWTDTHWKPCSNWRCYLHQMKTPKWCAVATHDKYFGFIWFLDTRHCWCNSSCDKVQGGYSNQQQNIKDHNTCEMSGNT